MRGKIFKVTLDRDNGLEYGRYYHNTHETVANIPSSHYHKENTGSNNNPIVILHENLEFTKEAITDFMSLGSNLYYSVRNAREIYKVSRTSTTPQLYGSIGNGTGNSAGYLTAISADNDGIIYGVTVKNPQIDAETNSLTPLIQIWKFSNGNTILFKNLESEYTDDQFVIPCYRIPTGITFDKNNNLYVSIGMFIVKVTPEGISSRIIGSPIQRPGETYARGAAYVFGSYIWEHYGITSSSQMVPFDSGTDLNFGAENLISNVKYNKASDRLIYSKWNGYVIPDRADGYNQAGWSNAWRGGMLYSVNLKNNVETPYSLQHQPGPGSWSAYRPYASSGWGHISLNTSTISGVNGSVDVPLEWYLPDNLSKITIHRSGSIFTTHIGNLTQFISGAYTEYGYSYTGSFGNYRWQGGGIWTGAQSSVGSGSGRLIHFPKIVKSESVSKSADVKDLVLQIPGNELTVDGVTTTESTKEIIKFENTVSGNVNTLLTGDLSFGNNSKTKINVSSDNVNDVLTNPYIAMPYAVSNTGVDETIKKNNMLKLYCKKAGGGVASSTRAPPMAYDGEGNLWVLARFDNSNFRLQVLKRNTIKPAIDNASATGQYYNETAWDYPWAAGDAGHHTNITHRLHGPILEAMRYHTGSFTQPDHTRIEIKGDWLYLWQPYSTLGTHSYRSHLFIFRINIADVSASGWKYGNAGTKTDKGEIQNEIRFDTFHDQIDTGVGGYNKGGASSGGDHLSPFDICDLKFISDYEAIALQKKKTRWYDANGDAGDYYTAIRIIKINFDTEEVTELLNSDKSGPSASWTYLENLGYNQEGDNYDKVKYDSHGGMAIDSDNNIYIADGGDNTQTDRNKLYKLTTNNDITQITAASVHIDGTGMTTFRTPLIQRTDMRDIFVCGSGAYNNGRVGWMVNLKGASIDLFVNPQGNSMNTSILTNRPRLSADAGVDKIDLQTGIINPFGEYEFVGSDKHFYAIDFTDPLKIEANAGDIKLTTSNDYTVGGKLIKGSELTPLAIDPGIATKKAKSIKLEADDITLAGNISMANNNFSLPITNTSNISTYRRPGAAIGSLVFNTNNNKVYVWTGSSWSALH